MGSGWHVGETFYAMTVKWLQWATTASGCCAAIGVVCWANLMLLRAKFILWWISCGSAYQGTKFQTILLFPWIWLLPQDWFPITNMIELSLCYEEWTSHFIRGYLTTGFYSWTPRLHEGSSWFFCFFLPEFFVADHGSFGMKKPGARRAVSAARQMCSHWSPATTQGAKPYKVDGVVNGAVQVKVIQSYPGFL